LGDKRTVAKSLVLLAEVAAARGQLEQAARWFGAGSALRDALGARRWPSEAGDYERSLAAVCLGLGERAFVAAWEEGRTMPLEQAIEEACAA
jgi:hypothetical protein